MCDGRDRERERAKNRDTERERQQKRFAWRMANMNGKMDEEGWDDVGWLDGWARM